MEKHNDGLPEHGFVKFAAVWELMGGISRTTLDREIRKGSFPPPIRLTERALGWPVEVIRDFFEAKRREQRELAGRRGL